MLTHIEDSTHFLSWINFLVLCYSTMTSFLYDLHCNCFSSINHTVWLIRSKSLWRWYISINIMFLDIIHRPVNFSKHNVSETGLSPSSGETYSVGHNPKIGTSSIDWAQPSRFYLKTETESSLRSVVFWKIKRTVFLNKDRTMDKVQKHNIYTVWLFKCWISGFDFQSEILTAKECRMDLILVIGFVGWIISSYITRWESIKFIKENAINEYVLFSNIIIRVQW
jgi:hypothetical protein